MERIFCYYFKATHSSPLYQYVTLLFSRASLEAPLPSHLPQFSARDMHTCRLGCQVGSRINVLIAYVFKGLTRVWDRHTEVPLSGLLSLWDRIAPWF